MNRRARRAKTDRLDALEAGADAGAGVAGRAAACGARSACRAVADEAARQVSRERTALTQDQTRLVNQLRGWLATWGATLPARRRGGVVDDGARLGGGGRCRLEVQARLARAEARLTGIAGADRGARGAAAGRGGDAPRPSVAGAAAWCSSKASRRPARRCCSMRAYSGGRFAIGARLGGCSGLRPRRTTVASPSASKGSVGRAMRGCRRSAFSWRGIGCGGNRRAR